ncbi:hypothetical protein [Saccharicrinis aurantiacus]|uniref:hypothetical protein n=1 Tax=Saccharicrinis aurantiacus TaxID=1849719 RepID=UPI0024910A51|nr:hypothetical protein [Saccharicrinis aurantiacus]
MRLKKYSDGRIPLIILLIIIYTHQFYEHKNNKTLEENHRYTIGNVYEHKYLSRGGSKIYFSYNYDGVRYSSSTTVDSKEFLHKNYFIKFNPEKPTHCEILLDKIIPKHIVAPIKGWKTKPRIVKKKIS